MSNSEYMPVKNFWDTDEDRDETPEQRQKAAIHRALEEAGLSGVLDRLERLEARFAGRNPRGDTEAYMPVRPFWT